MFGVKLSSSITSMAFVDILSGFSGINPFAFTVLPNFLLGLCMSFNSWGVDFSTKL